MSDRTTSSSRQSFRGWLNNDNNNKSSKQEQGLTSFIQKSSPKRKSTPFGGGIKANRTSKTSTGLLNTMSRRNGKPGSPVHFPPKTLEDSTLFPSHAETEQSSVSGDWTLTEEFKLGDNKDKKRLRSSPTTVESAKCGCIEEGVDFCRDPEPVSASASVRSRDDDASSLPTTVFLLREVKPEIRTPMACRRNSWDALDLPMDDNSIVWTQRSNNNLSVSEQSVWDQSVACINRQPERNSSGASMLPPTRISSTRKETRCLVVQPTNRKRLACARTPPQQRSTSPPAQAMIFCGQKVRMIEMREELLDRQDSLAPLSSPIAERKGRKQQAPKDMNTNDRALVVQDPTGQNNSVTLKSFLDEGSNRRRSSMTVARMPSCGDLITPSARRTPLPAPCASPSSRRTPSPSTMKQDVKGAECTHQRAPVNTSILLGTELELAESQTPSRRRRRPYPRFTEPGAVAIRGPAYGTPRLHNPDRRPSAQSEATEAHVVDAEPVESEVISESHPGLVIPVVDAHKLSLRHYFAENPCRSIILLGVSCVCLVLVSMVTWSAVQQTATKESPTPPVAHGFPTMTPSLQPTLILDEVVEAAARLSGWEALEEEGSPQRATIGWMSTVDVVQNENRLLGSHFSQRYALAVLYFSTRGDGWLIQGSWLDSTKHECDWGEGIFCVSDNAGRRLLTGIDLTRNGLEGTIPNEISLLSHLEFIKVANNRIVGRIPDQLSLLTNMRVADLQNNVISGTIPEDMGAISELEMLKLSRNRLAGSIPDSFYSLSMLQELDLSHNRIVGTISEKVDSLEALRSFDVRHNQISGKYPRSIDLINHLDFLHLDYNRLTGTLPPANEVGAGRLEITVSNNQLSGELTFSRRRQLQRQGFGLYKIDLSNNNFTGTISPLVAIVSTLNYIDVSGNQFEGPFPDIAAGWARLEHLAFANNHFTGTLPQSYGTNFEHLGHLDAHGNRFTGPLPNALCSYKNLEYLDFSDNELTGSLDPCLGTSGNLVTLDGHNNNIEGTIPPELGNLLYLRTLSLANNTMTGSLPRELGKLRSVQKIDLESNLLTGSLPEEIGELSQLRLLNVANNAITGTLPEGVPASTNLESLRVAGNHLEGVVSEQLCLQVETLSAGDLGCSIDCRCCKDVESVCGDAAERAL